MLKHPRVKYRYHAEFLDDDTVLFNSEKDYRLLTGKRYAPVLKEILHESLSTDALVTKLEPEMSAFEVYYVLEMLERQGYLTEAAPSLPPESCAYWDSLGIEASILLSVLQEKPITFESLDGQGDEIFKQVFESLGIRIVEQGVLNVVLAGNYDHPDLSAINQDAMQTGQPWMLVKPSGVELWIGPIFLPGKTGCWECLRQRIDLNRPLNALYRTRKHTDAIPPLPAAHLSLTLHIAASLTAIEITKWLYFDQNDQVEGKILTYNTHTSSSVSHVLVKRPQCPVCGNPEKYQTTQPIILQRGAAYCVTSLGGYREVLPEETLAAYQHHVSPITGVVQSLQPYYSIKGAPIYNYVSGHNLALRSHTLFWLNTHLRSTNGGKGKTWAQAKAGALCEAIERYSAVYQGDEPCIHSSLDKLDGNGIHPNACMNYSEAQYRNREAINRACSKFYALVPVPFDASLDMAWTPVHSLTNHSLKYLPSCFCYAQYPAQDEWKLFSYPDSNGGAAGNSLEEAILQGFLELVERDSVALWWYNRLRKPAVNLHSFDDPYFQQVIEYYASIQRKVHVLDLTADLGIPAFVVISYRIDDSKPDIIFGCGAHVDVNIAVERALVELNQILPIANVPEDDRKRGKYRIRDENFVRWLNSATLENQPYLVPLESAPPKTAADYPQLCEATIYDSVMFCIDTAARHGLETLVLDLTRPDIGLPVVKVIVPGLRHFWQRLAPGRLYDVPVKMGWLNAPLREEDLNPIALFI